MGKEYAGITPELAAWIEAQPLFFVGTAPLAASGHVNVSPKGLDTLRILGPRRVASLDLTGRGPQTIAHVRENGRIVLMFCAFSGPPKIVRLHGTAEVLPLSVDLRSHFPQHQGARAILDVAVTRISDSCGYGVPKFGAPEPREALDMWTRKKGAEGLAAYRRQKNALSIDGLPALEDDEAAP
jgi:hypothetical protein